MVHRFLSRLLATLTMVALSQASFGQSPAPIEIGVFIPLTGKFALPGEQQRRGIASATEDINAAGGINGRPVRLVMQDTSDSDTTAINAAQKLLEGGYPALLGSVLGTQMLAAMPTIAKAETPVITMSGTRKVTQQGNPWVFRITPHDGISKPALVKFAAARLKPTKAAILYESDEYGHSGRDLYLEQMKAEGIASVLEVQVNANDKDLTAQLLKLKNSGAQVIFSQLHDNLYALVLRQAARLRLTIPHVAALSAGNTTVADLLNPNELAGVYFESFFWTDDPRPSVQKWVRQYKEKYKALPDSYVALGYDQAMVLYKVMQTYGVDRRAIQAGLRKIVFDGFCGELRSDREQSMNHETSVSQWGPDKTYKRLSIIKVPFTPYQ